MEAAPGPPQETAQKPKRPGTYSGRLLLRMPETLHAELARASERAGTSLNAYINDVLARGVGKRGEAPTAAPRPTKSRLTERLLIVNLVVVAAVGVLAIVLIVQSLW